MNNVRITGNMNGINGRSMNEWLKKKKSDIILITKLKLTGRFIM